MTRVEDREHDDLDGVLANIAESDRAAPIDADEAFSLAALEQQIFGKTSPAAQRFGRYRIVRRLGRGGAGVVMLGRDDALARDVAIKFLHAPSAWSATATSSALRDLLAEARALAHVSHPNLVAVFDVGRYEPADLATLGDDGGGAASGGVFMVMERVDGPSLDQWLLAHPDADWRRIVALFVDAARGLCAMHRAGLVHRDFKPSNVMISPTADRDGVARLVDLGLARPSEAAEPAERRIVVGTLAFMSPEQRRGEVVDARSDQYNVCESLRRALAHRRPPPARLRNVIARGLASEPVLRWPDVETLIARLERAARPPLGATAGMLGIGIVTTALAIATSSRPHRASMCADASDALGEVWNDDRRIAVRNAVLAHTGTYSSEAWGRIESRSDEYARAWADASVTLCLAEREPARRCLDDRLVELDTMLGLAGDATAEQLPEVVIAVTRITPIESCDAAPDARAPRDPAHAEEIAAIDAELARTKAMSDAGRYAEAGTRLDALVERAHLLRDDTTEASVLLLRGRVAMRKGDHSLASETLAGAYARASAAGADRVAADAAIAMVGLQSMLPTPDTSWVRHAETWIERAGLGDRGWALLLNNRGNLALGRREFATARDDYRAAVARCTLAFGEGNLECANPTNNLGNALSRLGEREAAMVQYERALSIRESTLGPAHPALVVVLNNLASAHQDRNDADKALALWRRALAIGEPTLGPEHPTLIEIRSNLGLVAFLRGDLDEAERELTRAIAAQRARGSASSLGLAHSLVAIASIHRGTARIDEARAALQEAREILERSDPESPTLVALLAELADLDHASRQAP